MINPIDINADLGEGSPNDALLMPLISSCNIACGGHFGTDKSMNETIELAKKYDVKIGAHPSFPDKDNFGRKLLTMTKAELTEAIFFQLLRFTAVCEMAEATFHHVKLHGALYNYAAKDAPTADAVVEAITAMKYRPTLYLPYGSVLHRKAENLFPLKFEAFIDRRYNLDGSLVSRTEVDAVIQNKEAAWEQLLNMIEKQVVRTRKGEWIPVNANTFCIHGDHKHSVEIMSYISEQLRKHNIELA